MVMANDMEGLAKNFDALNCSPVEIMVKHNRDLFGDFQFTNWGNAFQMLEEALAYIHLYGLPKAYILIDEYDNFTNTILSTYGTEFYRKATHGEGFIRGFFNVIKFNDLVGFSEKELREMLTYYKEQGVLQESIDEIVAMMKPNYDNYCFSRSRLVD